MSKSNESNAADAEAASNREGIIKGLNEDLAREIKRLYSMWFSVLH